MSRVESLIGGRRVAVVLTLASGGLLGIQVAAGPQAQSPGRAQPGLTPELEPGPVLVGNFVRGPMGVQGLEVESLLACDLDDNRTPEVAALHDGKLVLFVNPDVGDEHVVVATDVRALAVAPGEDRFLFTTTSGLASLRLSDYQVKVEMLETGAPWAGARILVGAPERGLALVAEDGREFYFADPDGAGFATPRRLFRARQPVRELVLLDWNAGGDSEFAWLDSTGLQVRDKAGALLREHASVLPGSALVPIRGTGKTGLAWATRLDDGGEYLYYLRPDLPGGFEGPLALGMQRVESLSAGDLDGDGDEELLLGRRTGQEVEVLTNYSELPGVPTFAGVEAGLGLHFADESSFRASGRILCANFFNDHEGDGPERPGVAAFLLDPPGIRLVPSSSQGQGFATPDQPTPSQHIQLVRFESALWLAACDSSVTGPLSSWTITAGPGWNAPSATHLELVVRVSAQPGEAPGPIALHHSMTPLGPIGVEGTAVRFDGLEDPSALEASARVYFAQIRPVRLDASGTSILRAWRWSVVGVSAHCEGLVWLGSLSGSIPETAPILEHACLTVLDCGFGIPVDTIGGRIYIPSAVPQVRVPGNGPGVLPIVWPWDY